MSKAELRKEYLENRLAINPKIITEKSAEISMRLLNLPVVEQATSICGYLPFRNEVDLTSAYEELFHTKILYFPKFEKDHYRFVPITSFSELSEGRYGILEPTNLSEALTAAETKQKIDLWLIPLLAFDSDCNRLGYGAGYYDRFLLNAQGKTLGVAFDSQKTDRLFKEEHDVALNAILTESSYYEAN